MTTQILEPKPQNPPEPPEVLTGGGYLKLLRNNRNFRHLWLAQVVSQLGDWFDLIALTILVLRYNPSAQAVSFLLILRLLPALLLSPLAGVLADRFNRRNLLMLSDLGRAGIVLGFLLVDSPDKLWLVYLLTVLQFSVGSIFEPARNALIPALTRPEERVAANALSSFTWSVLLAVGAALGGVTTGWLGLEAAFVIDAFSFLVSAWFVKRIPTKFGQSCDGECGELKVVSDLKDGFSYLKSRPNIFAYTLIKPLIMFTTGIFLPLMALQAQQVYPVGQGGSLSLGLLYLAIGVGSGVGPLLSSRLLRRMGENRLNLHKLIGLYFVLIGVGYALFAPTNDLLLAILFITIAELGGGSQWVFSSTLLQLSVKEAYLGRVFAVEMGLMTLFQIIALLIGGVLIDQFGFSPLAVGLSLLAVQIVLGFSWIAVARRSIVSK